MSSEIGVKIKRDVYEGDTESLFNLCVDISDCHHSTPKWTDIGKIVIRNFNFKAGRLLNSNRSYTDEETYQKRISRSKPMPGDLIISREAPMGEVCIIPDGLECCLGQRTVLIKPDTQKVNNNYLLYALLSEYVQTQINRSNKTGSTVSNLRIPDLKALRIPVCDPVTEDYIGSLLGAVDRKIAVNNNISEKLEAMAKTLYDYWFVQFDFPDGNAKPYKSSGGKMEYNETFRKEIPEGWEVSELGVVLETALGGTPSTKEPKYWDNANISWLNSGEISNFPVVNSEERITQKGIDNSAAVLLPKGSVAVSIVRHIRVSVLAIDSATNQSVVGIYETEKLKHSFIYPYLSREIPRLMSIRTGAQQPHINKGEVDASPIVIPNERILSQYYQVLDPIYQKIMTTAFEIQQLTQLRNWLLPMLMNGQVRVE